MSILIKEINRYVKHLLLSKTDIHKTSILPERNLKKYSTFEEKKDTRYIRGNVYFDIIGFTCLSSIKPVFDFF